MNLILDNIIFFLQKVGGGSVHWIEIIKRLNGNKDFKITFTEPNNNPNSNIFYNLFRKSIFSNIHYENIGPKFLSYLPYDSKSKEKFIYHSSYYRISKSKKAINIVTIHDLIPEMYFTGFKKMIHTYRKKNALKRANAIICVSKNTLNDLRHYYPFTSKIFSEVIHNGVSNNFFKINPLDYNKNNKILFIGKRTNYKNFYFAIDVLKELNEYSFLIIGEPLNSSELNYIKSKNIDYELLEKIDDQKLKEVYNNSFCLLYPSSYEGFGIPIIEAMKCGCPVVALKASAIKEIANEKALLIDELNLKKFSKAILSLEDIQTRKTIIDMGLEHSKNFDWDNIVEQYVLFYKKIYNLF